MVYMIPDWLPAEVESSAEAKLFRNFQEYNTSDDIYVLHSLALGEHVTNVFGEVDFVIICPRGVLCMEVKGGNVYRENGTWYFQNRYGKKDHNRKGPFKQVQGNAQSLRGTINGYYQQGHPLYGLQFACCVMTPDCHIEHDDTEIIQDILFDKTKHWWDLGEIIQKSFDYWEGQLEDKHNFKGKSLTKSGEKELAVRLRGDFHIVPSMKSCYDEMSRQLLMLTDEQYEVLENHKKIKRMFVEGRAGTGKTLLAVEQCRRETLEGNKVLYLCYNYNIAQSVRYSLADEDVDYDVFTLHKLLMHLCGEDDGKDKGKAYFDSLIPRFLSMDISAQYDVLIVDEGQDLLKKQYVQCMDRLLKGGMQKGRWTVYYDPNQNVYGENEELDSILKEYEDISAPWSLSLNCRNTRRIARVNRSLTGYEQAKTNRVEGKKPEWRKYSSIQDELDQLWQDLEELQKEGVENNRIVLLSPWPLKDSRCCLFHDVFPEKLGTLKTVKPWTAKKYEYRFSTINTFKGLEADVVMLLDLDGFEDEENRKQNYVAISRARTDLYIYYSEDASDEKDRMAMGESEAE